MSSLIALELLSRILSGAGTCFMSGFLITGMSRLKNRVTAIAALYTAAFPLFLSAPYCAGLVLHAANLVGIKNRIVINAFFEGVRYAVIPIAVYSILRRQKQPCGKPLAASLLIYFMLRLSVMSGFFVEGVYTIYLSQSGAAETVTELIASRLYLPFDAGLDSEHIAPAVICEILCLSLSASCLPLLRFFVKSYNGRQGKDKPLLFVMLIACLPGLALLCFYAYVLVTQLSPQYAWQPLLGNLFSSVKVSVIPSVLSVLTAIGLFPLIRSKKPLAWTAGAALALGYVPTLVLMERLLTVSSLYLYMLPMCFYSGLSLALIWSCSSTGSGKALLFALSLVMVFMIFWNRYTPELIRYFRYDHHFANPSLAMRSMYEITERGISVTALTEIKPRVYSMTCVLGSIPGIIIGSAAMAVGVKRLYI